VLREPALRVFETPRENQSVRHAVDGFRRRKPSNNDAARRDGRGEVALRAGIQEVVADPVRASKMLAAVDEIEAAIGELNSLIAVERASLRALLLDHGSSRAAVDASLAEFNANHEALARRCLTAHAALKAEATAAEWKKLRKLELEMMTFAATRTLGQAAPAGKEG
jgi:hypothetical protein